MTQFIYSICLDCHKINRISQEQLRDSGDRQPACGNCKKELPVSQGVNELDSTTFTALVEKSSLPVVTDFWAPWCQPCKVFAPTFEQAAHELGDQIIFAKINTEEAISLSATYGIRSIPTLILFQDGKEDSRQQGALSYPALIQWLKSALLGKTA